MITARKPIESHIVGSSEGVPMGEMTTKPIHKLGSITILLTTLGFAFFPLIFAKGMVMGVAWMRPSDMLVRMHTNERSKSVSLDEV